MILYKPTHKDDPFGLTLQEIHTREKDNWRRLANLIKLHSDLAETRAALKLILESPTRCSHAIAEMALLASEPSGLENILLSLENTP